jgi:hypothetical protein
MSTPLLKTFFDTLFEPNETINVARNANNPNTIWNVNDLPHNHPYYTECQYYTINAVQNSRADANVTSFRNFLIENDNEPVISEQIKMIKRIGVPYSAVVFSGNKSLHFIVSLATPLKDASYYRFIVDWLYNIINKDLPPERRFDMSTRNPSRLSRLPGGTHQKQNKPQTLLQVKGRVPDETFENFLLAHQDVMPKSIIPRNVVPSETANPLLLKPWTNEMLSNGIFQGKRNSGFYEMGWDFIEAGYKTPEEALQYIFAEAKHLGDFPLGEVEMAVRSAYKGFARQHNS